MRLIDADPMRQDWLGNGENDYVYDTNSFLGSIDEQPTIDPIHAAGGCYCYECKYSSPLENFEIRCEYHDFTIWPEDGFCSYGERENG